MEAVKRRFGQIGKLKKEKIEEYERLHAKAWPGVLKVINSCNLKNYSIFRQGDLVFTYYEYTGCGYDKDMEKMEEDETTREWWKHTKPCFETYAISAESEFYHDMKQIFYYKGMLGRINKEGEKMGYGKKVWIFPDAELPPVGLNSIPGHESIIITNINREDAHIQVTFFYTDKNPVHAGNILVKGERVRCLRTNEEKDFGAFTANFEEQYAIMLESDISVVAQYGRAEPRNVAFYTTPGFSCD